MRDETKPFPLSFSWRLFLMSGYIKVVILFNYTCLLNIILRVALIHAELLSKSSKPNLLWLFVSINRKDNKVIYLPFTATFTFNSCARFSISFKFTLYKTTFEISQGIWSQITRYKFRQYTLDFSSYVGMYVDKTCADRVSVFLTF